LSKDETENCSSLCTLKCDLSGIPKWKFERKTGRDHKEYYVLDFEVQFTFFPGMVDVDMLWKGNGMKWPSSTHFFLFGQIS
jgi:hypothetical protein